MNEDYDRALEKIAVLAAENIDLRARVAALEAGLRPFAERSEQLRLVADVVAGNGRPCSMQPVRIEDLIRAAALLSGGEAE